jgi:hypothetical protein
MPSVFVEQDHCVQMWIWSIWNRVNAKFCVKLHKSPTCGVEIKEFPQAKEATDVKIKDENIIELLFITVVSSNLNLYLKGTLLIRHSTWRWRWGLLMPWGASGESCVEITHASPQWRAGTVFASSVPIFTRKRQLCVVIACKTCCLPYFLTCPERREHVFGSSWLD